MGSIDNQQRFDSVDLIRGLVMVLMALDHVRFFLSPTPFAPENMERTWPALFFTRWITHFCAPVFFLLAGMGARLAARSLELAAVRKWLASRGLWLAILELTVIGFAWRFVPGYSFAGVIWCLGLSMMVLSVLISVPDRVLVPISVAVIAGHHILESVSFGQGDIRSTIWTFAYEYGMTSIPSIGNYFVLYPLLPWVAVMILGWSIGSLYSSSESLRNRIFIVTGSIMTVLFVLLRFLNSWGNGVDGPSFSSRPFEVRDSLSMTLISLLNVEKYPPSFQYLLMTLGPTLVLLALISRIDRTRVTPGLRWLLVFGRVPFFFYLLHLYLIHVTALVLASATGQTREWLWFGGSGRPPAEYGFSLTTVWIVWVVCVAILYVPCSAYETVRSSKKYWWTRWI